MKIYMALLLTRAISITEVTIKLAVLFGPWYITPRTRLPSVVCTVCDRIFTSCNTKLL